LRKAAVIAFALAVTAGFAWLVKAAAGDDRTVAYSLGVPPSGVAATISPGKRGCQEPVDLAVEFGAVAFPVATEGRPGEPLELTVRTSSGRVLGRGKLAAGYVDGSQQTAQLDRIVGPVDGSAVCIANEGDQPVSIYGSENVIFSHTTVDGAENPVDLDLRFLYDKPRPFIDLIPDAFDHVALFRFGWVGAWVYWLLLAVLAIGAPLLLGFGLWRAAREDDDRADALRRQDDRQGESAPPPGSGRAL
jgi:hypothetical protein